MNNFLSYLIATTFFTMASLGFLVLLFLEGTAFILGDVTFLSIRCDSFLYLVVFAVTMWGFVSSSMALYELVFN